MLIDMFKDSNRNLMHTISSNEEPNNLEMGMARRKNNNTIAKKKKTNYDRDLEYLDFWSKYYASTNIQNKEKNSYINDKNNTDGASDVTDTEQKKDQLNLSKESIKKSIKKSKPNF